MSTIPIIDLFFMSEKKGNITYELSGANPSVRWSVGLMIKLYEHDYKSDNRDISIMYWKITPLVDLANMGEDLELKQTIRIVRVPIV